MSYDKRPSYAGKRKAARPRGLKRALLLTAAATVVPALLLVVVGGVLFLADRTALIKVAVRPAALLAVVLVIGVVWLLWMGLIWGTWSRTRPPAAVRAARLAGVGAVALMSLLVTLPLGVGARYAWDTRDAIRGVFSGEDTATRPHVTVANPWGHRNRVNVLLLGGDGAVHRPGVRTDSMILASINVHTGKTLLISMPRNLERVPFPAGSPLAEKFPNGFEGPGSPNNYLLNAVYKIVPEMYPGILGSSDNEGADAIKQAISGALGMRVDYYVLVNLGGFQKIIDAIGGITVNVNEPVPVGGNSSEHIPPDYWIQPGPDQKLDGFHALWFARGRYGSSDYSRMRRQRCAFNAIVAAASPINLFRHYTALADAGKRMVRTDIPRNLLPAFVDLANVVKGNRLVSVGFERTTEFNPNDPDYDYVRERIKRILYGHPHRSTQPAQQPSSDPSKVPEPSGDETDTASDCSYHPAASAGAESAADQLPRGIGTPAATGQDSP